MNRTGWRKISVFLKSQLSYEPLNYFKIFREANRFTEVFFIQQSIQPMKSFKFHSFTKSFSEQAIQAMNI